MNLIKRHCFKPTTIYLQAIKYKQSMYYLCSIIVVTSICKPVEVPILHWVRGYNYNL